MTPREVIERAVAASDRRWLGLRLRPGLSASELARSPKLPPDVRALLRSCTGFDCQAIPEAVSFTTDIGMASATTTGRHAFELAVVLGGDGCGNSWVVDVDPDTGGWGKVFFFCHDPPACLVVAEDLAAFLRELLLLRPAPGDPPALGPQLAAATRRQPSISWEEAIVSDDDDIRSFASTLAHPATIWDLRSRALRSGFPLAAMYQDIRRWRHDDLFATPGTSTSPERTFS